MSDLSKAAFIGSPARHGVMQAIARVNRVFKDKPGGLVVDLASQARHQLVLQITFALTPRCGSRTGGGIKTGAGRLHE